MIIPFACRITTEVSCAICQATERSSQVYGPDVAVFLRPVKPRGWTQINSSLICPAHDIDIQPRRSRADATAP